MSAITDQHLQRLSTSMDTTPVHSQSTDVLNDFPSLMGPPHLEMQHPPPHITHAVPPSFPIKSETSAMMPASLHVSLPDVTVPATVPPLAMLDPSSAVHPPPPELSSDFPANPFGMQGIGDDLMQIPPPQPLASTSHAPSHLPLTSPFNTGTSSLASALDKLGVGLGPSHSALSNGISSPGSEQALSSIGGKPSPDSHNSPFIPSTANDGGNVQSSSPEAAEMPHRMVVQGLFSRMNKISQSALHSCTKGDPNEAIPKITELMKLMLLTGTLVLDNPSGKSPPRDDPPLSPSGTPNIPAHIPSSNASTAVEPLPVAGPSFLPASPQYSGDVGNTLEVPGTRKRCASSMSIGDDRVNKALKMEPDDDIPLDIAAVLASGPLPPANLFPAVPLTQTMQPSNSFPFVPPNPLSQPASRPPSPPTLATLQRFPVNPPVSHPTPLHPAVPFAHLNSASVTSPSSSKFDSTPSTAAFPPRSGNRSSWSDVSGTQTQRHLQHSYSAGSLSLPNNNQAVFGHMFGPSHATQLLTSPGAGPSSAPRGRVSRTGSVSKNPTNAFGYAQSEPFAELKPHSRSMAALGSDREGERAGYFDSDSEDSDGEYLSMAQKRVGGQSRPATSHGMSPDNSAHSPSHGNDIPQEVRAEVDRIFFEYLNRICSDLEATDAKGEPIHQTLMAKKMQRLDESPDFRPFKFRIAAFTHGFLEELARQGYPEDKIPMKKVRNYLWSQPHIVRYNEEGKKVKSKGNHTWNMDAKKMADGTWKFREFHRQLAGAPPTVSYIGLLWSWTPRIWHPQGHLPGKDPNVTVKYSSPSLPSWLSWKDDVLSGTPTPGADSCDITVEARLTQDGHEEILQQTIHLTVAPPSLDPAFPSSSSRRPSMQTEVTHPRRVASDPTLSLATTPRSSLRSGPQTTQDAQVLQVLTSAAQRVAQVAQSQVIGAPASEPPGPQLQSLAKQQHVLTVTAQALDRGGLAGELPNGPTTSSNMSLAAAAQHVVFSAARQVVADHSAAQVAVGIAPSPMSAAAAAQVTVDEVSAATQSAVAQAVEITGPLSSEMQVLMTASSLLQWQTTSTEAAIDTALPPPPPPPTAG